MAIGPGDHDTGGKGGGGNGGSPPPPSVSSAIIAGPGGAPKPADSNLAPSGLDQFYALIALHSQIYKPVWKQVPLNGALQTINALVPSHIARIAIMLGNTNSGGDVVVGTDRNNLSGNAGIWIAPKTFQYFYFGIHGSLVMQPWWGLSLTNIGQVVSVMELLIQDVRPQHAAEDLNYGYRNHQAGAASPFSNPLHTDRSDTIPSDSGTRSPGSFSDILSPYGKHIPGVGPVGNIRWGPEHPSGNGSNRP